MFPNQWSHDAAEIKAHTQVRRDRIEGNAPLGKFLAMVALIVLAMAIYVVLAR
ncbi:MULTISPECIES: hypothetical protein [unclassified Streptomyces]|uniref:hypothetical protein n=1 Tax=unclassified Streptomyces TaxID=2593676 RepID=UPI0022568635|nr:MULTISPECIES: hypothetical protein [unclassified Streptomyces]MCX5443522.1 hypothetical protein [Streptomyces sp. NBC_00063]WUB98916.1 hypothetical protein OHO83_45115 [Streptomyces sp. NBC_00569]